MTTTEDRVKVLLHIEPNTIYAIQPVYENRVVEILDEIDEIDNQLREVRKESMTIKVDDISVNYNLHVNHLKSEGSRLLRELAFSVNVPLVLNRSTGGKYSSRYSVVSYYG